MSNDAGKGSLQRPCNRERYAANYERIWGSLSKDASGTGGSCDRVNPKSESCEFCKRNPDAVEIQTRFFCPEKGEPLDG